ncbi:methyltransferase [Melanomma pulvis-pyrius CBS 109.77]|uniref:Methyltransferase n=1 Tax=Melanomma pulvis-pyrius CBS 109.77 TaxID=1314802 RepID=A0A6A6X0B4_9PLEO|nr:methyltransferase [Melanomma pulvis-pyrius CBS 109.77]
MAIVESQMSYLEPWGLKEEAPYIRGKVEDAFPRTNFTNQVYKVQVHDARPEMDQFSLDTHGFAFHRDDGINGEIVEAIREKNKTLVEEEYYPQISNLVKRKTGASKVIVFDHTYRRRDPSLNLDENPNGREQPATLVHCDQSAIGAVRRVKRHAGEEADKLLQTLTEISVWRPIHGVVEDWALAVMDYQSIKASEIHPTSIFAERFEMQGQTVSINHSADQRWYYINRQTPDETTFIKIWDSKVGVAKMCAHCAFPSPQAPANAQSRESIEVRCLVFYDHE